MTATSHSLTGAVIGLSIGQPLLAIPMAFISHLVLDSLPHYDFGIAGKDVLKRNKDRSFHKKLALDSLITLSIFAAMPFIIDGKELLIVWACMLASIFPDLIWGWRFAGELRNNVVRPMGWFSRFHKWLQWKEWPGGLAVEIILVILLSGSLLKLI